MSKSLQEWLASSDEEEKEKRARSSKQQAADAAGGEGEDGTGDVSPKVSEAALRKQERLAEVERLRKAQEEARLAATRALGISAAAAPLPPQVDAPNKAKTAAPVPSQPKAKLPAQAVTDSRTSVETGSSFSSPGSAMRSHHQLPPTAPTPPQHSGASPAQQQQTQQQHPAKRMEASQLSARDFEEEACMVADRGTQTACTVECQTDPDPYVTSCPSCYQRYYGHKAPEVHDCARAAANVREYPLAPRAVSQQPVDATVWRAQLDAIHRSVDAIIHRYNLPPPPSYTT